jgi:hypothetical protein
MQNSNISDEKYDLSTITRDELQFLLSTAKEEIVRYTRCYQEIKRKNDEIAASKNEIEDKQNKNRACRKFFVLLLIGSLIGFPALLYVVKQIPQSPFSDLFIWGWVMLPVWLFCLIAPLLDIRIALKKIKTAQDVIKKCKTELSGLEKRKEDIINGFKAIQFIPERWRYEYALKEMLGYIEDRTATNWERCTDLYKEDEHRRKLERLAEQTAEDTAIQRELAEENLRAMRSARTGIWTLAAITALRR